MLLAISIAIGIPSAFLERALYHLKMAKRGKALSSLKNLFQEVIRYNNLVRGASVKLRLSAIKNELDEADIKKLEQVFSSMQDELVKALKIERLLRENKAVINFNSELFEKDQSSFQSLVVN
jgi:hypothetical protein